MRNSECILYNEDYSRKHKPSHKQLTTIGCDGSENVNTGEISLTCVKFCKWYKPKKVDEYARDKEMWRR